MTTVKELPKPKHGTQRNWRIEKGGAHKATFIDNDGGEHEVVAHSSEHSASERFCANCDEWITARGILGGVWCPKCETQWHQR